MINAMKLAGTFAMRTAVGTALGAAASEVLNRGSGLIKQYPKTSTLIGGLASAVISQIAPIKSITLGAALGSAAISLWTADPKKSDGFSELKEGLKEMYEKIMSPKTAENNDASADASAGAGVSTRADNGADGNGNNQFWAKKPVPVPKSKIE